MRFRRINRRAWRRRYLGHLGAYADGQGFRVRHLLQPLVESWVQLAVLGRIRGMFRPVGLVPILRDPVRATRNRITKGRVSRVVCLTFDMFGVSR